MLPSIFELSVLLYERPPLTPNRQALVRMPAPATSDGLLERLPPVLVTVYLSLYNLVDFISAQAARVAVVNAMTVVIRASKTPPTTPTDPATSSPQHDNGVAFTRGQV